MPTYEYACTACANQWEEIQKISEDALDTCPKCQQKTAKRQISGGNFILKGGGWYADLYSSSSNKSGANASKKGDAEASTSKSEGASTTKTESPAATAAAPAAPSTSSTGSSGSGSSTPSKK